MLKASLQHDDFRVRKVCQDWLSPLIHSLCKSHQLFRLFELIDFKFALSNPNFEKVPGLLSRTIIEVLKDQDDLLGDYLEDHVINRLYNMAGMERRAANHPVLQKT